MSKKKTERKLADDEAMAFGRSIRVSPQKLGLVAGLIRGKNVQDALVQLTFSKKAIASEVKKLLESAIANAENNHSLDIDRLYISQIWVGKGIVMKRVHSRARGRTGRIIKPFSNMTIIVKEREEAKEAA